MTEPNGDPEASAQKWHSRPAVFRPQRNRAQLEVDGVGCDPLEGTGHGGTVNTRHSHSWFATNPPLGVPVEAQQ